MSERNSQLGTAERRRRRSDYVLAALFAQEVAHREARLTDDDGVVAHGRNRSTPLDLR